MTDTQDHARSSAESLRGTPDVTARRNATRTVAVVGLGYVGLPTSISLAAAGHQVIGIDISTPRLADVQAGRVDLTESDRRRLAAALDDRDLLLTGDTSALRHAEAVIVCVPTPLDGHRLPALTPLQRACADVVARAVPGQLIILTSTSYVGTTRDLLAAPLRARGLEPGRDVHVAFAPERIDPGNIVYPQERVPRVVGGVTPECTDRAAALLGEIAGGLHTVGSCETAELTKLFENTFRAVNIALVNELADVSASFGLNPIDVITAAATKPYGFMPFYPGPGVGGHCIPVDPHYLLWQLRRDGVPTPLVEGAMDAIALRPARMVERAVQLLSDARKGVRDARVLMVGVTYKAGVADLRGSPAVQMLELLDRRGARLAYHDPLVEQVRLESGIVMRPDPSPDPTAYDLVIVHGLHPQSDHSWLSRSPLLLDCTYRLPSAATGAPTPAPPHPPEHANA